jgi:hypothetical protein
MAVEVSEFTVMNGTDLFCIKNGNFLPYIPSAAILVFCFSKFYNKKRKMKKTVS